MDSRAPDARRSALFARVAAAAWLMVILGVMTALGVYSNSPGVAGTPSCRWPIDSRISLGANCPTLVMVAHPRCPCTRASIGELELLVASYQKQFEAHILFVRPEGTSDDWTQTDLWKKASSIPGVKVYCDEAGREARRFGLETSGHTVLYDPNGRLKFQGGITIARGHAGDNAGRDALSALLRHESPVQIQTPVFGCPLMAVFRQPKEVVCQP